MESRPDLAQAEHIAKAQAENVNFAKGQYSPELFVNGSWGFQRLSNLEYGNDDQASAVALELRWELFTGGFRTAQLRRAQADWWESRAALKRKRLEVASDVRTTIIDLKNAQEQVILQRVNLESAKENRRIVQTEYASGKASLVRLNEAQRDLVETDAELARSRIRLRQAWSDLRAAAGAYRPSWMVDDAVESQGPYAPDESDDELDQPAAP
jgi:outer membrane protein TolC